MNGSTIGGEKSRCLEFYHTMWENGSEGIGKGSSSPGVGLSDPLERTKQEMERLKACFEVKVLLRIKEDYYLDCV